MRVLAAILFLNVAMPASASAQQAVSQAPFDYQGIALDTPLAAMRSTRPPDGPGWRLTCHIDDYFGPQVQDCSYRDRSGRLAPLRFDRTRHHTDDHVFFFAADRVDGTLRLFRIVLTGTAPGRSRDAIIAGFRHDVVAGLTGRFGPPQEDNNVANSVGFEPGNLDSLTSWRNAKSTIEVTGPNQSEWELDRRIRVFYDDPDLAARAFELRQSWLSTRPATR